MQKHVNLVDLVKSFPTSIYYLHGFTCICMYLVYLLANAKCDFDTAESEQSKLCRYQHTNPGVASSAPIAASTATSPPSAPERAARGFDDAPQPMSAEPGKNGYSPGKMEKITFNLINNFEK